MSKNTQSKHTKKPNAQTRAANKNADSRVSKYANQSEMSEYPPPIQAYKKKPRTQLEKR